MTRPRIAFVKGYRGYIPWSQRGHFWGYERSRNGLMLRAGRFVIKLWIA